MASVLTIDGTDVARAGRIVLNRLTLSMDVAASLEFTEKAVAVGLGTYHEGQSCVLTVDDVTRFSGVIVRGDPMNIGTGPIDVGYRAMGLGFMANQLAITATDGTGALPFNFPSTDPDYRPNMAGKSVGDILKEVFDLHADALAAIGITGYTASELTALTVVPVEPVVISGRLWNACQQLLATWCNKYAMWVDGAGLIHVVDTISGLTPVTMTLDSDPVVLGSVSRDHSECFTRVIARGGADIEGAYLSLKKGTLVDASLSADISTWTIADYYQPKDASDSGAITSLTSTTLTVTSDNSGRTWPTNFWSTQVATIWAENTAASDVTFQEQRNVISCTSLAAGGTSVITLDYPLNNSGYTTYFVRGNRTALSEVYRKYTIPNTYLAQHLQQRFNHSVAFSTTGATVAQTYTVTAVVCWSTSGSPPYNEFPATLQVVPYDGVTDGYLVFDQPTVFPFNSLANMEAGGTSVVAPSDLIVLVPYSRGAITATAPSSGYEGTAYTVDGVERTLYLDFPQWLDARNITAMTTLTQETLDTLKDTVVEGTLTYLGKYSDGLTLGQSLNIAIAGGGATGMESLAARIRTVTLEWPPEGANLWITRLGFSTRRRPFAGDRLYVHPNFGQEGRSQASLAYHPVQEGAGIGMEMGQSTADASGFDPSGLARQQHSVRSGPTDAQKDELKSRPDQIGGKASYKGAKYGTKEYGRLKRADAAKGVKNTRLANRDRTAKKQDDARIAHQRARPTLQGAGSEQARVVADQNENARRTGESRTRRAIPDPALAGEGGPMRPAQTPAAPKFKPLPTLNIADDHDKAMRGQTGPTAMRQPRRAPAEPPRLTQVGRDRTGPPRVKSDDPDTTKLAEND